MRSPVSRARRARRPASFRSAMSWRSRPPASVRCSASSSSVARTSTTSSATCAFAWRSRRAAAARPRSARCGRPARNAAALQPLRRRGLHGGLDRDDRRPAGRVPDIAARTTAEVPTPDLRPDPRAPDGGTSRTVFGHPGRDGSVLRKGNRLPCMRIGRSARPLQHPNWQCLLALPGNGPRHRGAGVAEVQPERDWNGAQQPGAV